MGHEYKSKANIFFKNNKKNILTLGIFLLCILIILGFFLVLQNNPPQTNVVVSNYSTQQITPGRTYFSINSESNYLYKSKKEGIDAVEEFVKKNGRINGEELLPKDFYKNSKITRVAKDSEMKIKYSTNSNSKEHYFFNQTIHGIPVYGASLIVHLQKKNEIYSVGGNIAANQKITEERISSQDAIDIAKKQAIKDSNYATDLVVKDNYKSILNLKILGLSNDVTNYLSLAVQIDSARSYFSKRYYIALSNQKVLYSEDLIDQLMVRKVYDCNETSNPPCALKRSEGQNPIGNVDGDSLYDLMGDVYNYYFNTFGRDALDGAGSPLQGIVNIYSVTGPNGTSLCSSSPNAYNTGGPGGGIMAYCKGMATRDIAAHEFTHGVVSTTAQLNSGYQYGALNESIADAFANAIDNNWTMGEGSRIGIIRNMSNPPSVSDRFGPSPDKLFSPYYDCSSEEVHHNDGVHNKAFFLMTDGGSFNGCTVSGLGTIRSHAILYKALTQYLPSTANFYDMYTSIIQACGDLYGASSSVCDEAKKAYQAAEMDQQTPGSATGASCPGSGKTEKPATCTGQPSSAPISQIPTAVPTGTPTPTLRPGQPTPTNTPIPTVTALPTTIPAPTGGVFQRIGTPTPTPDQYFTCKPDPTCIARGKSIQLCPLKCTPQ